MTAFQLFQLIYYPTENKYEIMSSVIRIHKMQSQGSIS